MHDAADVGECLVQLQMSGGIAGGLPFAVTDIAVQIHNDHIFRGHAVIGNAGGLDDHKAGFPVDAGHIAPCEGDEIVFRQEEVGFQNLLFQLFEHNISPICDELVFRCDSLFILTNSMDFCNGA